MATKAAGPAPGMTQMQTVLVVDDERQIRAMVRAVLEDGGYRVLDLDNGASVVAVLLQEREPVIVLTDLEMPGIDGYEVCRRLASDPRLTQHPVVVMTGTRPNAPPAPAREMLLKPFDITALEAVIARYELFRQPVALAS